MSHYHADHVTGVVRSKKFDTIASKVWLTSDTANFMINTPHKPSIEISQDKVDRFIVTDFEKYYPIAPGLVAIKAPGILQILRCFISNYKMAKSTYIALILDGHSQIYSKAK